jgi:hypothetical protein
MPVFTDYPTTKQTSLSDLLGTISGAQQFQQQQQLMPLQLEKAQLELQRQRETQNPEIERIKSLSRQQIATEQPFITQQENLAKQSQTKTLSDQFAYDKDYNAQINQKLGGFVNDKRLKGNASDVLSVLKDAENEVKLLTKSDPQHEIKTEARFAPLKVLTTDGNHAKVEQALKNIIQSGISPTSQQILQTPQLTTAGGQPAFFRSGEGTLTPAQIQGANAPQGTQQGTPEPQMSLPYEVRKAGDIRPFAPNEEEATKLGFERKTKLTNTYNDLSKIKFNIDQVIRDATKIQQEATLPETGPVGGLKRRFAALTGDPQYQKLEKDLANVVLANETALGHQTDAGRQLRESASGKLGYDPSVLVGIAKQAKADTKNIEMQTQAVQKFTKNYGDNNISAFQEKWGENSDSRIFQGLNIMESNLSDDQKRKELQKIYVDENNKPLSSEEIAKLRTKQQNLLKLQSTGSL